MVRFRKFIPQDKKKFEKLFGLILTTSFPTYSPKTKEYIAKQKHLEDMMSNYLLCAFEDDRLVGFLTAEKPYAGVWYASWIGVDPDYTKRGIGTQLVQAFEKTALQKGIHNIQLHCEKHNLNFYKKLGFEEIGIDKKGYFGIDEYLLHKLIAEPIEENFLKD